jgi:hypothetical protein
LHSGVSATSNFVPELLVETHNGFHGKECGKATSLS